MAWFAICWLLFASVASASLCCLIVISFPRFKVFPFCLSLVPSDNWNYRRVSSICEPRFTIFGLSSNGSDSNKQQKSTKSTIQEWNLPSRSHKL